MGTNPLFRALGRHKVLAVVAFVAASGASVLSSYRVEGGSLTSRAEPTYSSMMRLLVTTSPTDLFANVTPSLPDGLNESYSPTELADLYTLLFPSDTVKDAIQEQFGSFGPGVGVVAHRVRAAAGVDPDDAPDNSVIPVLELTATARTSGDARRLADTSGQVFLAYVAQEQQVRLIPPERAVQLAVLNKASGGSSLATSSTPTMALVFVAIILGFIALGFMLDSGPVTVTAVPAQDGVNKRRLSTLSGDLRRTEARSGAG